MVTERIKKCTYQEIRGTFYFWRTYDGQELDLVEEREGRLYGYEFKWSGRRKQRLLSWIETYGNAGFEIINSKNYLDFVT